MKQKEAARKKEDMLAIKIVKKKVKWSSQKEI